MTGSHRESTSRLSSEVELRGALEKAGLRFTRQRAAVYQVVHALEGHPTVEEVYEAVKKDIANISLATIYKALDALVAARLVTKITDADGPCRYDCRREAHYHFHCLKTHQILDLPIPFDPDLLQKLDPRLLETLRSQGFQVTGYRLELVGISQSK
jgi:Fur family transcriptional regulator, peroxide stress response regulator